MRWLKDDAKMCLWFKRRCGSDLLNVGYVTWILLFELTAYDTINFSSYSTDLLLHRLNIIKEGFDYDIYLDNPELENSIGYEDIKELTRTTNGLLGKCFQDYESYWHKFYSGVVTFKIMLESHKDDDNLILYADYKILQRTNKILLTNNRGQIIVYEISKRKKFDGLWDYVSYCSDVADEVYYHYLTL